MIVEYLTQNVSRLRDVAERNNCVLKATFGIPATDRELQDLEAFLGVSPPRSLVDLLAVHNGVSLEMFRAPHVLPQVDFFSYNTLILHGTRELISRTEDLRGFIDTDLEVERERAWRCLEFASNDQPTNRIIYYLGTSEPRSERAVFHAHLDTNEWISKLSDPDRYSIAASIDDFVERSIESMLRAETFYYWSTSARKLWPR